MIDPPRYGPGITRIDRLDTPESPNGREVFAPGTRGDWRDWLVANPDRSVGVWVVFRKKSSSLEGLSYDDLVEEALCFGWIDSQERRVDDDRLIQWYSPRRKGSPWSASNKERVERLIGEGLMTQRGLAAIDAAKADGTWTRADEVEAMIVPPELEVALAVDAGAQALFEALPPSHRKQYLAWIAEAKREETRRRRVEKTLEMLLQGAAGP